MKLFGKVRWKFGLVSALWINWRKKKTNWKPNCIPAVTKQKSPPLDKHGSRSSFVQTRTSRSAFSSFPPLPSSSSGGASPSPLLPSSSAASFISTLTCSLSPSVRNQRSSVVSDTMAVSSSCAGDSWQISQTTTVTLVSLAPLPVCKTVQWHTI